MRSERVLSSLANHLFERIEIRTPFDRNGDPLEQRLERIDSGKTAREVHGHRVSTEDVDQLAGHLPVVRGTLGLGSLPQQEGNRFVAIQRSELHRTWCIGRLQTDADRARVVDGLAGNDAALARTIAGTVQKLSPRWFVMRDIHAGPRAFLMQPRWAMSWLRGPMTRTELRQAIESRSAG